MKRKLFSVLILALALAVCAWACAEETKEADLLDLWDTAGETPVWVASVVPAAEGVAVTVPSLLPEKTDSLAVSDGKNLWAVKAVVPDSTGSTAMILYDQAGTPPQYDSWPFLSYGESVRAASCIVRYGDELGSRINRRVLSSEDVQRKGFHCYLLTLSGPAPVGSPLLTQSGNLAGIVIAEWAEGLNRVLALSPEGIVTCLTEAAVLLDKLPAWGRAPEGLTVSLDRNKAVISWKDMALPEKKEGETLYLVVMDTGNNYLNYIPAETDDRTYITLLTPGRHYIAGILASESAPQTAPEQFVFFSGPEAGPLTEFGFRAVLTAVAEAPEGGLKEGEAPVPVKEVTEELLRSGRAYFYSHTTYEVTEQISDRTLLISLTDPEGVNYRYESGWIYAPEYMEADIWYLPMRENGLTPALDQNGYPRGVYRLAFYVNGELADSLEFELK